LPFRRRFALFAPGMPNYPSKPGVHVQKIDVDSSPFQRRYDPGYGGGGGGRGGRDRY